MDAKQAIEIVRHLMLQKPYDTPLTEDDYRLLRDNQISGSLYPLIKHQADVYKGFKEDYYRYIQRDEVQMQMIEEIRMIFNQNDIDFVFLKGAYLKTIYTHSYMRAMGDIDLLIRPDQMEKVHEVLENNQFKNWSNSANHDCFMKNHINVEVHPKLDSEISDEYNDLFLKPWLHASKVQNHEYHLNLEYRYFYQIYHMIKHLYHSGVGLRSLIDLYYLFNRIDMSCDRYQAIYNEFPRKKFIDFINCLYHDFFSKTVLSMHHDCDKINPIITNDFINYMMDSGTHGIGEQHNLFIGGMASSHNEKGWIIWTKIKFLLSKTFLSFEQMRGLYPYLKKCPLLLPYAYIERIFKLLFKKSARRKLKRFKANKEDIETVENLFKHIGIK